MQTIINEGYGVDQVATGSARSAPPVQRRHIRLSGHVQLRVHQAVRGGPPGHDEPVSCHLRRRRRVPEGTQLSGMIFITRLLRGHESQHTSPGHQAEVDRWDWLHVRDQEEPEKRS